MIKRYNIIICLIYCIIYSTTPSASAEINELNSSLDFLLEELSDPPPSVENTPETESIPPQDTDITIEEIAIEEVTTQPLPPSTTPQEDSTSPEKIEKPLTPPAQEIVEKELSAPMGPFIAKPTTPDVKKPQKNRPKAETAVFTNKVQLEGLNKITARTSTLITDINTSIFFGTLEIKVERCWKSAPEDLPENKALIRIWEKIPGELRKLVYYGWMFSSSPSLSPLEHPVYDITVTECIKESK